MRSARWKRRSRASASAATRTLSINRAPVLTLWAAVHTKDGLRALAKEKPVDPESVERYLESKFGDGL